MNRYSLSTHGASQSTASRLNMLKYLAMFAWWWPQSVYLSLLNVTLQVYLQMHTIMAFKLEQSRPPSVSAHPYNHGHEGHPIMLFTCIIKLA